jgi:hypothetical protein
MGYDRSDAQPAAPSETLAGTVERVTFQNPETGFAVLKVKGRGKRDLITVIGHAPTISPGEFITASGVWVNDRTHGVQFKAQVLKTTAPTTRSGKRIKMPFLLGVRSIAASVAVTGWESSQGGRSRDELRPTWLPPLG